jgi:hypothetical protein
MRARHAGQGRDLARVVHADLDHREGGVARLRARGSAARPSGCCRRPPPRGLGRGAQRSRSISFVPVLPTLPVTPTKRAALRVRRSGRGRKDPRACPRARAAAAHQGPGRPAGRGPPWPPRRRGRARRRRSRGPSRASAARRRGRRPHGAAVDRDARGGDLGRQGPARGLAQLGGGPEGEGHADGVP